MIKTFVVTTDTLSEFCKLVDEGKKFKIKYDYEVDASFFVFDNETQYAIGGIIRTFVDERKSHAETTAK